MAQASWRLEGEWLKNHHPVAAPIRCSSGAIKFDTKASHSSLARVVQTPKGVAA